MKDRQAAVIVHLDELRKVCDEKKIAYEKVCIVGSGVLAWYGIRANNDLEIALEPEVYRKFVKSNNIRPGIWGHTALTDNIDLFHNIYGIVGFDDRELFESRSLSCGEFRIALLEDEWKYKHALTRIMKRKKDHEDIGMIRAYCNSRQISFSDEKSIKLFFIAFFFNAARIADQLRLYFIWGIARIRRIVKGALQRDGKK
jgi:hypothetical protein